MAAQHQAAGRNAQIVATDKDASNIPGCYSTFATGSFSQNYDSPSSSPPNKFKDSGYCTAEEPSSPRLDYEDFILYEDEPPFIDEEASMIPNHGSIYNGTNNKKTAWVPKYASYPPNSGSGSSVNQTANTDHFPAQPSLFGDYELVTGPTPLQQWVITPHRHEANAYLFEQPPYPADRLTSPTPPSPTKRRRTKSKSRKSSHRKH
ncbi:hypothetical protein G7Y89_g13453 [Cudoniella acicularis]|uniref:Uncharacterized protein n=1 Tax=Cudoniella acicularis TaxID=354080 RepID=A0A8H4VW16_9HELO|nr:hypothetical protein G7Y89_g13453 [Cudoniella acicularis]